MIPETRKRVEPNPSRQLRSQAVQKNACKIAVTPQILDKKLRNTSTHAKGVQGRRPTPTFRRCCFDASESLQDDQPPVTNVYLHQATRGKTGVKLQMVVNGLFF